MEVFEELEVNSILTGKGDVVVGRAYKVPGRVLELDERVVHERGGVTMEPGSQRGKLIFSSFKIDCEEFIF